MYIAHPEKCIENARRGRELMLDPEYKRKCTEKMIEAAQRTGGTSKQELALSEILSPLGYVHRHRIGKWHVDFYNQESDTVIEFYGDWWHCHPRFLRRIDEQYGGIHPNIGLTPEQITYQDSERIKSISKLCRHVVVLWQNDIETGNNTFDTNKIQLLLSV
jgi:hypothetical protein